MVYHLASAGPGIHSQVYLRPSPLSLHYTAEGFVCSPAGKDVSHVWEHQVWKVKTDAN